MRYDLYINNKLCDLSDDSLIVFTYTMEQLSNPTAVKNTYSHEVELPQTERNDAIFTHFYRNDYRSGDNGFLPLVQVPFVIYDELGEIAERGYIKLDEVRIDNTSHTYKITLYGGLGSFFYAMAYDNNKPLSLADLQYLADASQEDRLNITISRASMDKYGAWGRLAETDQTRSAIQYDVINFAPTYQGLPNGSFDANKALFVGRSITYQDNPDKPIYGITSPQGGNTYYKRLNADSSDTGYRFSLVELPEEHDEWEMKDLRTYLQRPVLSVRKFVEAVQRKASEYGYNLQLDNGFFNNNNPYYNKTWITLPSLQSITRESREGSFSVSGELMLAPLATQTIPLTTQMPNNADGYEFGSTKTDISVTIPSISVIDNNFNNVSSSLNPTLHLSTAAVPGENAKNPSSVAWFISLRAYSGITRNVSDIYVLVDSSETASGATIAQRAGYPTPPNWSGEFIAIRGKFAHKDNRNYGNFYFTNADGEIASLTLTVPNTQFDDFELLVSKVSYHQGITPMSGTQLAGVGEKSFFDVFPALYLTDTYTSDSVSIYGTGKVAANAAIRSGSIVTKQELLNIGKTPLELLLSYCKMFGLVWLYDKHSNTVSLMARNVFYGIADVVDWSGRIDTNRERIVRPFEFDKRFYDFELSARGEWAEAYKSKYGVEYGRQRVNTGYSFDNESKNLLDGSALTGGAEVLQQSIAYCNITVGGKVCPSVFLEGGKYELYDNGVSAEYDVVPPTPLTSTIDYFNNLQGYDYLPKLQLESGGNIVEESGTLLLHVGNIEIDSNSPYRNFRLTDDLAEMSILNDGTPCWVIEGSVYGSLDGETIPHFVRAGLGVSLDMGVPQELDNPTPDMSAVNNTIYSQYWRNYLSDRYHKDSRLLTCYVDLRGIQVGNALFRNFYYFDGAIWALNKINNYSMTTEGTTQCEFVKVQDIKNYKG